MKLGNKSEQEKKWLKANDGRKAKVAAQIRAHTNTVKWPKTTGISSTSDSLHKTVNYKNPFLLISNKTLNKIDRPNKSEESFDESGIGATERLEQREFPRHEKPHIGLGIDRKRLVRVSLE